MVRITLATALAFALTVTAIPNPLTPDPAGAKNVGNGAGTQFIGGACLGAADCASGCCATLNGAGICSGPGAQFQAGKTGCGFESGGAAAPAASSAASDPAATTPATSGTAAGVDTSLPGSQNVGLGNGQQFITGQCFSDADCASGCCANPKGVCSATLAANQDGKTGCGFVNGAAPAAAAAASPPATTDTTTGGSTGGTVTINSAIPGATNVGNGAGKQFITGQCIADADCASGCCANPNGVCSGPAVANTAGKTGCGFVGTLAA